jgi:GT2 family glycosyltransferase
MPAYNHERFVRQAVESVLRQTYANWELIVIDDASRDGTWEALQSFTSERLRLYRHETNQGAHAALNRALTVSRGEFIAILDSDDVFDPKRIERLVSAAAGARSQRVFAFSDIEFIDPEGNSAPAHSRAQAYQRLRGRCEVLSPKYWFLAGNLATSTSNFFFSRQLLEKVGGFSPLRYTHDWDWALRANLHGPCIWLKENLLYYRVHEGSTLSEHDVWRHVHENSYLQATALLHLDQLLGADAKGQSAAHDVCVALLSNESLHPLSLLCFLVYGLSGVDAQQMLERASPSQGGGLIQQIAACVDSPADLFLSIGHLAAREETIAAQKALIEERWQAMQSMQDLIVSRDKWIADQSAMLEERWNAMQKMSGEIARMDSEIRELRSHPLVRAALIMRRGLVRLGLGRKHGS